MNKSFFIFLFFSFLIFPEENNSTYPIELEILVETYNKATLTEEQKKAFVDRVKEFETLSSSVDQFYLFHIIKSNIYQIIKNVPPHAPKDFQINNQVLAQFNQKIVQEKTSYSLFSHWVLESLQSDLWDFFDKKNLNNFNEKNFLNDWVAFILNMSSFDFNQIMEKTIDQIMQKIVVDLKIFVLLNEKNTKELSIKRNFPYIPKKTTAKESNWELLKKLSDLRQKSSEELIEKLKIPETENELNSKLIKPNKTEEEIQTSKILPAKEWLPSDESLK